MRVRLYNLLTDFYNHTPGEDYFQDSPGRRFYRALYFETFRKLGTIEGAIEPYLKFKPKPEIMAAIVLGTAQILYMRDVPDYAAVNESVNLVSGKNKGFVNAVLRNIIRNKNKLPMSPPMEDNFPDWLVNRWKDDLGASYKKFLSCLNTAPPTWYFDTDELKSYIEEDFDEPIPGRIYMDKASSSVAMLAGDVKPETILDCCAAPGGKTTVLSHRYPGSTIFAVELDPDRFERMKSTLDERGLTNINAVNSDIMEMEGEEAFDLILLDAPCTALGTLRKHPEIRWLRTEEQIKERARIQRQMLKKVSTMLKPGGRLIYSVCSLEPEETTDVVEQFVARNTGFDFIEPVCEDIFKREDYFVSRPCETDCDGFFAAVLRKG
ncbi:RsmB/NOP family class I SAM-dependent RNA methyltransferase [Limisalsivibrio acetivorans]|uniref:RsmB/NOP family class I SAM-dependent RNA methyltransferase n=1 Tax=Limisalsivibrio acetivorans TaxID=1304888 RepID=UPI00138ABADD|nr:RsmB/NOP family class I SAM-dependent RNA methyltransferase [Limisalsivibrio acetivorans]